MESIVEMIVEMIVERIVEMIVETATRFEEEKETSNSHDKHEQ